MDMKTWNIYIAESVYTKKEDGKCYKNYLSLKTIAEGLNDFRTECWPIIDEMKNELISNGAWEGCLSRSEDWCEDHLTRYATDSDTERDSMFPDFIGIDIITTPFTLSLKSE